MGLNIVNDEKMKAEKYVAISEGVREEELDELSWNIKEVVFFMNQFNKQHKSLLLNRIRSLVDEKLKIKDAFTVYFATEGCSCCEDTEGHNEAMDKLGKLLHYEKFSDGSGWDVYTRREERK